MVKNTKFRSTAQALGRVANITDYGAFNLPIFRSLKDLIAATYRVDLNTKEQFQPSVSQLNSHRLERWMSVPHTELKANSALSGVSGPILPIASLIQIYLSMETGVEVEAGYKMANGLRYQAPSENQYH